MILPYVKHECSAVGAQNLSGLARHIENRCQLPPIYRKDTVKLQKPFKIVEKGTKLLLFVKPGCHEPACILGHVLEGISVRP